MRLLAIAVVALLSLSVVTSLAFCDFYAIGEPCDVGCGADSIGPARAAVSSGSPRALQALPVVAFVRSVLLSLPSSPAAGHAVVPAALPPLASIRVLRI